MTAVRIMTYNIGHCRGGDGRINPDRVLEVIGEGAPDIAALQEVGSDQERQLHYLAERLGMREYAQPGTGENGFLSYFPLKGVQNYDLGDGGCCLRADADIDGKRLHLFNLRLDPDPSRRSRQLTQLLGPELLGNPSLVCPLLVLGDFADLGWGPGNLNLLLTLRKAPRPWWSATYPARFPLLGRDRAYLRGHVRILETSILRSPAAKQAATHLPLTLTVQVADPRRFLTVQQKINRMEAAPG